MLLELPIKDTLYKEPNFPAIEIFFNVYRDPVL